MRYILALLLLIVSAPALTHGSLREIREGENVVLRPDRAYILFRSPRPDGVVPNSPVFLRIPNEDELNRYRESRSRAFAEAQPQLLQRYRAELARGGRSGPPPSLETFNFTHDGAHNVDFVDIGRPFLRGRPESTFLVETVPGDYVLYGMRYGNGSGGLHLCMCLGTVGFRAAPGVITDLGYFLSDRVDRPSPLSELRAESGFGPSSYGMLILAGATVRPVQPTSSMPEALRSLTVRPAAYRAVGRFVEPRAAAINRLAPVPGILDYRSGRVIDLATGRDVPDVN